MHRRAFLRTVAAIGMSAVHRAESGEKANIAWLAGVQQPPPPTPGSEPALLSSILVDAAGSPITTLTAWEPLRNSLRDRWLDFLGPLSRQHLQSRPAAPKFTTLGEERIDGIVRRLIRYKVEQHQPVEAYVLQPEQLTEPVPGVVVFHTTTNESLRQPAGVEGAAEKAFGLDLARQGCVTICPRNYLWPKNHGIEAQGQADQFRQRHPESRGMDRMLLDGLIAVDLLQAHPQVDSERMGCIGHSLGAKEALYVAAFDERIKATVSSEGGIGIRFSNWNADWYLGPTIKKPDFGLEHHQLLALVAPRPFLLVGGDAADGRNSWPFIAAAMPVYQLYSPNSSPAIGLFNHHQGHSVPPEAHSKMLQWIEHYLRS
ncbi:MAG: dienelactone hydrolase family protein [Planctomycetaceae bacterium]